MLAAAPAVVTGKVVQPKVGMERAGALPEGSSVQKLVSSRTAADE